MPMIGNEGEGGEFDSLRVLFLLLFKEKDEIKDFLF